MGMSKEGQMAQTTTKKSKRTYETLKLVAKEVRNEEAFQQGLSNAGLDGGDLDRAERKGYIAPEAVSDGCGIFQLTSKGWDLLERFESVEE